MEKGKPDPGTPASREYDERIVAARRHVEARQLLEQRALDALRLALSEHEAAWRKMVDDRLSRARLEWLKKVDALTPAREELGVALGLGAFLAGDGRQFRAERGTGKVPLRRSGDHHVSVDALLNALRSLGQEPAETEQTEQTERALRVIETTAA